MCINATQSHFNFTHFLISSFISIRVHGGQEVDSRLSHQSNDALVALLIFSAQILHEVEYELSTEGLVPVHPRHIAKLWLACQEENLGSHFYLPSKKCGGLCLCQL